MDAADLLVNSLPTRLLCTAAKELLLPSHRLVNIKLTGRSLMRIPIAAALLALTAARRWAISRLPPFASIGGGEVSAMRRCALFLLIALALALLAVGAQAQERGDAAGEPPAAPRMTRLSWSGLTIRAEWNPVARATGYDLRWTLDGQQLVVGAEREVDSSPAEFSVSRAGRWRVEVRARIGSGPSAARGEWSRPLTMRLYDPPPRLEVERFDGEYARLNWTGVGAHYELEWGERGKAKRLVRRDGRSPTLELGPLEGGKTYEFRVRARNNGGRSGYSPTAVFTPTGWRGGRPGAAYVGRIGQIYALWFPQRGAEWYELSWINAAEPTETARVRVGTATSGGSRPQVPGQIGRLGGFEDGTWNVRVRAGPRGVWSPLYPLTLSNQPERLVLELESSRELCTAGTLTEVSWKISGGSAPYALSVENSAVDVSADNARINCGALSEAEAADEDASLAAKRITATVTDARGVRREAAINVARVRALPAPTGLNSAPQGSTALFWWEEVSGAGSQSPLFYRYSGAPPQHRRYLLRHQPIGAATWIYEFTNNNAITLGLPDGERLVSVAAIRHPLEADAPGALAWSAPIDYANVTSPTNVTVTATHDTITVAWDVQRHVPEGYVALLGPNGSVTRGFQSPEDVARASVRFNHLTPATNFTVRLKIGWFESNIGQITVQTATKSAPPGYRSLSASPQRLQLTATHDSITVAWEPPYSGAEPLYYITISEELTGRPVARRVVHDGATTWTEYGSFTSIQPATTYHVVVRHGGIRGGVTEATITTSTRPTGARASSGSSSADRTLHLRWPVRRDSDYAVTDDPFDYRPNSSRYHAGLDFGSHGWPQAQRLVQGDPVLAAADGWLRLFNADIANAATTVYYCPNANTSFHWQFLTTSQRTAAEAKRSDFGLCDYLVGATSGRTVLMFHDLGHAGTFVTKYAHLASLDDAIATALAAAPDNSDGLDATIWVTRGTVIGHLGNSGAYQGKPLYEFNGTFCHQASDCTTDVDLFEANKKLVCPTNPTHIGLSRVVTEGCEHEFLDPHLHFELRQFTGTVTYDWYTPARNCYDADTGTIIAEKTTGYCEWTQHRELPTVLHPEHHLPPPPASSTPKDPGVGNDVTNANLERRAFEITTTSHTDATSGKVLRVDLSIAFWRPAFYAGYSSGKPRERWAGIRGTRPGVTGYGTDITALSPNGSDAACGGGAFQLAPAGSSATTEGELPRQTREVRLSQTNGPCVVHILTTNSLYPTPEVLSVPREDDPYRRNIAIPDPKTTLTWVAELSAGVNVVRTSRSLVGDALDLYTFTARRGYTYRFCTYPSSQSTNECADESDGSEENSNVAQLLIIGTDGSITDGVAKNTSGLAWTVPDNAPLEGDYVLVVRRRARVEGSVDDYSYTLKYTVPPIEDCASLGGELLFLVCIPPKPTPSISSRTHNTVTVSWPRPTGALSYETKPVTGENCAAEGIVRQFNPHSADAAGVVSGAGNQDIKYPFPNLTASTPYKLCVRSVRTISSSFVLKSDWASVPATTRAEQLPKPGTFGSVELGRTV